MSAASKYLHVATITWKSMLAYQADTWLGTGLSGVRVILSFLLWTAVFAGRSEVGGYTLPVMITYALISSMLARLQHQDTLAWQLANEIREGIFSKYLTHPISVVHYFLSAGLGCWIYLMAINALALLVWGAVFSPWLVLPSTSDAWWTLALLPLGAIVMLLFNQAIASLSFKFQEVGGLMVLKNSTIEFFSGALIPLQLLPVPLTSFLRFTPFYYVVYYPSTLLLGKQTQPPAVAVLVLLGWCILLYGVNRAWFARARRYYEGVGI